MIKTHGMMSAVRGITIKHFLGHENIPKLYERLDSERQFYASGYFKKRTV